MGKKYCGLILRTSYPALGETSPIAVLGKSMEEWVKLALAGADTDVADNDPAADILSLVRPHLKPDCDYAVVLYTDTPLITRKTVEAAVEEASVSGREVIRMTRGYVISAAHAIRADRIYTEDTCYFDEEDFITAFSYKQIGLITDIMKNRILDYHMSHGVRFEDLSGTVIGCDVSIEAGAVIGYNNIVVGGTCIRRGRETQSEQLYRGLHYRRRSGARFVSRGKFVRGQTRYGRTVRESPRGQRDRRRLPYRRLRRTQSVQYRKRLQDGAPHLRG